MDQMEQSKDRNFVCKFCSKRFSCGKSLGGHIRTHTHENSVDSDEDEADKLKICDNGGQSSYGLRENPKKNKRFTDQTEMIALKKQQQILLCKECGKGFSSLKALCGHMACHSDRDKMAMDSQSDSETSSTTIRRRSKRVMKRHRAFVVHRSCSASEVEQEEQEELALCLMMLSRDYSNFKKVQNFVNCVGESSDTNSVILETKSSSGELKHVGGFRCNADEISAAKNQKQLKSPQENGVLLYDSDNSDSGYFRNGPRKVDSDVSIDGFLRNAGSNKAMMESGFGFSNSPAKQDKNLNRLRNGTEFRKESYKEGGSSRSSAKYDLRKSKRVSSYSRKKIETNELNESVHDSGENSLEADSCSDMNHNSSKALIAAAACKKTRAKKRSKGHECPICFRVFKSGQALGGHKRSHFMGSHHENSTVVIQQEVTQMHTMIDLNLPAPFDE
ncbi:PREDICTED: uncharacterized protein LOC104805032 isoform X1 [Tarenaya hassleriana]|uniref:uncharacterized protein LOC104805032 isoform X1 n=2 Tax=Tarenaya hassleriana TaxID=28532 RepID=UPI00053C09B6|nr:PREDICTED: uncharacterized protein LOC104805032 isoform X1 [Tarenaya hassleriana]